MWRGMVVGLLAGCGRIGFEPTSGAGASGDGASDGITIEAACLTDASYTQWGPMRFKVYPAVDWVAGEQQCELDGAHLTASDIDDCVRFEEANDVTRSQPCTDVLAPLCECDERAAVSGTY